MDPGHLGDLLARGLAGRARDRRSACTRDVRPWAGTFADVELRARRLAAGLRERGASAPAT